MCIAIFCPAGKKVPETNLSSGWVRNPDGGGFAFYAGGKIHMKKGYTKYKDFLKDYKEATAKHPNAPFLVHFRIRSMGDKGAENTHPYTFKHGVMIHNGTLSGTGANHHTGLSDTALFIKKFGDDLPFERLMQNVDGFSNAVSSYNKMVFLFKNGKHVIVNEKSGAWIGGVWYSNTYSLADRSGGERDVAEVYGCSL